MDLLYNIFPLVTILKTHTHTASSRPAAERLLQPSLLPPFEFSLLSFLIGCKHICKLFRGEHIYVGDQAPSLSVGPRNCSNSPCIYTFDDHAEARKRVKASAPVSDREITAERASRKWKDEQTCHCPLLPSSSVVSRHMCGRQSEYTAPNSLSMIQHCVKGKQRFVCL